LTIGAILTDPTAHADQSMTISGEYRGWEGGYGSPPVTRSDWVIKDATGGIYVTGQSPAGLDPVADRGKSVTVTGTIRVKNGKPYIEAILAK